MLVVLLAAGLGVIVGDVLLGIAVLRSGAVQHAAGVLILASGVVYAAGVTPISSWVGTIAVVALLVGLAICGFQLLRTGDVHAPHDRPSESTAGGVNGPAASREEGSTVGGTVASGPT